METLSREDVEQFVYAILRSGRSAATARSYRSDLMSLAEWCETNNEGDLPATAAAWLTANRTSLSAKTTGRRYSSARAFLRYRGIEKSSLDKYRLPTPKKMTPHPLVGGMDDVRKMIAVSDNIRHQALIILQGFGGMRVTEALSVDAEHINVREGTIEVRGKGDKGRIVPFDPKSSAWRVIRSLAESTPEGPIIGLSDRGARNAVTEAGRKAGVRAYGKDSVSSHDLRATAATALYVVSGHNIRLVQEFLGHANVKQTEVYVGVSREQFTSAVAKL